MNKTKIEWTDFTANPLKFRAPDGRVVWACEKLSAGCKNCYAEKLSTRYAGVRRAGEWNAATMATLTPFLDEAELRRMLTYKPAAGKRVFVGDMTDVFGAWVPDVLLDQLFAVFALRPDVTWQVLTKRAERMRAYMLDRYRLMEATRHIHARLGDAAARAISPIPWPLPNVWLGVSVEDQRAADERLPHLRQTPAAVRFVSAEPLLSALDLRRYLRAGRKIHLSLCVEGAILNRSFGGYTNDDGTPLTRAQAEVGLRAMLAKGIKYIPMATDCVGFNPASGCPGHDTPRIDWVIAGGESGDRARPMHPDWARSLRDQCAAAGVGFFFKQQGAWAPFYDRDKDDPDWGSVPEESPRVARLNLAGGCGFHGERVVYFRKTSTKAAGRTLDGREWNDGPPQERA